MNLYALKSFSSLSQQEMASILEKLAGVSVAVVGDFCLDVYWTIDRSASETSIETGLKTEPVRQQRYSAGGAGNVVMNLLALGVKQVYTVGVVGNDPFGRELRRLLENPRVNNSGLITQNEGWATHAYLKPCVDSRELSRIDHGNFNSLANQAEEELFTKLENVLDQVSVVLINHQVSGSIHDSASFRRRLAQVISLHSGVTFVIDSRGYHEAYPNAIHKLNDHEVMRACGRPVDVSETVAVEDLIQQAQQLSGRWKSPLVVTRGKRGCIVFSQGDPNQIFGLQLSGQTDPVGAGDTFSSSLIACVSTGANLATAAFVANAAAAVTVQKLFQTGTATPQEILTMGSNADFIYYPELAQQPRHARYVDGTEIEIIGDHLPKLGIRHAIFDHDGTISTLREGWERIMEPMMIKAILGDSLRTADEALFNRVRTRVRDLIERTTGIQTIVQMHGLVELVKEFGIVPTDQVLPAIKYKGIFNEELIALVNLRLDKLDRGELEIGDFTMRGAVPFLHELKKAGVQLYLASGTDEADVKREAERLGYADVFEGRIYGSIGEVAKDAKKIVIERILNGVNGASEQLVTFGDGPVEMRETIRRGAFAIGIASDELRRFGMNPDKRTRLIHAGANVLIPDFSQWQKLWKLLQLSSN
jgi:rfaE bifunctional protein kinase chain/domain